ncbi:MAG TPA: electron transfer flavoprotein subunit beta/FixA family protein [Anaerolineales bacterium]|nr:electron transfer flavoprotein subunit beta/FixA family protein [Anaerolineales bacterium]
MNIVVPVRLVPDLVEEINVDPGGTALDASWLRLIINEFDDHAIEQAILLKERGGGQVCILAPSVEGVDDVLFTAAAKGADRLVKLEGLTDVGLSSHALARALAPAIQALQPDLILTGVQAHTDLDGPVGPLIAESLGFPYVGYVASVTLQAGSASVRKEYPGGLVAGMEVRLPAVLGIQAAEKPPRYVAVSKVRQAMQTARIETQAAGEIDASGALAIQRMFQPEAAGRATMIDGEPAEVADRILEILRESGIV